MIKNENSKQKVGGNKIIPLSGKKLMVMRLLGGTSYKGEEMDYPWQFGRMRPYVRKKISVMTCDLSLSESNGGPCQGIIWFLAIMIFSPLRSIYPLKPITFSSIEWKFRPGPSFQIKSHAQLNHQKCIQRFELYALCYNSYGHVLFFKVS